MLNGVKNRPHYMTPLYFGSKKGTSYQRPEITASPSSIGLSRAFMAPNSTAHLSSFAGRLQTSGDILFCGNKAWSVTYPRK